ncbi:MAG: 1,4-alpha-glucan branching protein domain-containing protein [Promethearchaeota archaeon]
MRTKGYFTFVLHSHLPWVLYHGTWPHGMSWINEAAAESYVPLLIELFDLIEKGYDPRITIGITPVLAEMLSSDNFKHQFKKYLEEKISFAVKNQDQFKKENFSIRAKMAKFWQEYYLKIQDKFIHLLEEDITRGFKKLQDMGVIEIITSAATHGYFPLLSRDTSIIGQIKTGIGSYRRIFGKKPRGFWLPECAYRPGYEWKNPLEDNAKPEYRRGIEYFLSKNDIEYFFVDTHLTMGGIAQGVYAARFKLLKDLWRQFMESYKPVGLNEDRTPYQPYLIYSKEPISPVGFFTRDEKTGVLVWSGEHGYPGDGNYLEFHKKHHPGGLRYWKVTGTKIDLGKKMEYYLEDVPPRLDENASHFKQMIKSTLIDYYNKHGRPGILLAIYDTELFGHWWFEGIWWLNRVLRWIEDDPEIELTTAGEYYSRNPPVVQISLPEGSWGQGGGHWVWLNEWTIWTWRHVYECEDYMKKIIFNHQNHDDKECQRIIRQLGRELLLLQSSDWQFLISTWSARDYAEQRVALHHSNFIRLKGILDAQQEGNTLNEGDLAFLTRLESEDSLFQDINPLEWFDS